FSERSYSLNNQRASSRGVPIVRFYLYSANPDRTVRISSSKGRPSFTEFCTEVQDLNSRLQSLYSIGVNVDKLNVEVNRDLFLMDDRFLAETLETDAWLPIRAEATQNKIQLAAARGYLSDLWGRVGIEENKADTDFICRAAMADDTIHKTFGAHKLLPRRT